jgi:hypothetical protein
VLTSKTRRLYRVSISHCDYPAAILDRVDPAEEAEVELPRTPNIGSIVMHATGYIPRSDGRLGPILDTSHGTYLHADNIAIEGGAPQPAIFQVNV